MAKARKSQNVQRNNDSATGCYHGFVWGFNLTDDVPMLTKPTSKTGGPLLDAHFVKYEAELKELIGAFAERHGLIMSQFDVYGKEPYPSGLDGQAKRLVPVEPDPVVVQPETQPETDTVPLEDKPLTECSVKVLREYCKALGLKTGGSKAVLVARLEEHSNG